MEYVLEFIIYFGIKCFTEQGFLVKVLTYLASMFLIAYYLKGYIYHEKFME